MIQFSNVSKAFKITGGGQKIILQHASFTIGKGQSPAIMGINGMGKSTLIRMIAGNELPDKGQISRLGVNISWPLGFSGGFQGSLSARENCRFVARIYGRDPREVIESVMQFAELNEYFDMPVKTYSSGMRSRLAFGLSMAVDFDFYLVDEILAVGDARFKDKCMAVFETKRHKSNMVMVSHSEQILRDFCNCAFWLIDGHIYYFDDVKTALSEYNIYIKSFKLGQ